MDTSCEPCSTAFPELEELISQFKCGICYEIMTTPMITSCSHTYCSLCIRSSISYKQICPSCPSVVRDDSLKINLALDNCISPFLSLQKKLHQLCGTGVFKTLKNNVQPEISIKSDGSPERELQAETKSNLNTQQLRENTFSGRTKVQVEALKQSVGTQSNESKTATESKSQAEAKHFAVWMQSPKKIQTSDNLSAISKQNTETPSTSSSRLPGAFFTSPKSSSRLQNDAPVLSSQSDNVSRVSCPVCLVQIPERNINLHLDKCLSSQEDLKSPPQSCSKPEVQKREPLKKMVYHMMSEKEIRKKLKEYGLDTKGDRTKMSNRLHRYTVLYNSECDSRHPRPVSEIKRQLEKEEEALNKHAQPVLKTIRIPKTADPNEIEEINRQYIDKNRAAFDDLIKQARERQSKTEKKELPRGEAATPKRTNAYNSKLFEQMKTMENDTSPVATRSGLHPKRSRDSDDDSDEFLCSLPSPKATKRNKVAENEEDDFVLPKIANTPRRNRICDDEDSVASRASTETKTTKTPKRNISKDRPVKRGKTSPSEDTSGIRNSLSESVLGEDDNQSINDTLFRKSESPVLNRRSTIPDDSKPVAKRVRRQRIPQEVQADPGTRRQTRQKTESAKATQPTRRKTKSREAPAPVRTVSRTPSLSPSHFEGFNESGSTNERERSQTPELSFENSTISRSVPLPKSETGSETDPGDVSLSQLVSLMNRSGDSTNFDGSDTE